jgi:hypothetical protein
MGRLGNRPCPGKLTKESLLPFREPLARLIESLWGGDQRNWRHVHIYGCGYVKRFRRKKKRKKRKKSKKQKKQKKKTTMATIENKI